MGMDLAETTASTVTAKKTKKTQVHPVKVLSFGKWKTKITKQKLCIHCMKKHDSKEYEYKEAVCNFCGHLGHISPDCYQKQSGKEMNS